MPYSDSRSKEHAKNGANNKSVIHPSVDSLYIQAVACGKSCGEAADQGNGKKERRMSYDPPQLKLKTHSPETSRGLRITSSA